MGSQSYRKSELLHFFYNFVKTEACFASRRKAESGSGKFVFDGKRIIVDHIDSAGVAFNTS